MSITEAARLTRDLARDSTSALFVALHDWDYPLSQEAMATLNLTDLLGRVHHGRKWKALPRPWETKQVERLGVTDLTQEEVIAALRAAGHDMPLPSAA